MGTMVNTLEMIDALRSRGAVEVTVNGVSARFAAPLTVPVTREAPKVQSRDEQAAEYERVLLGSVSE